MFLHVVHIPSNCAHVNNIYSLWRLLSTPIKFICIYKAWLCHQALSTSSVPNVKSILCHGKIYCNLNFYRIELDMPSSSIGWFWNTSTVHSFWHLLPEDIWSLNSGIDLEDFRRMFSQGDGRNKSVSRHMKHSYKLWYFLLLYRVCISIQIIIKVILIRRFQIEFSSDVYSNISANKPKYWSNYSLNLCVWFSYWEPP